MPGEVLAVFAFGFFMLAPLWGPALVWWLWPEDDPWYAWLEHLRQGGR